MISLMQLAEFSLIFGASIGIAYYVQRLFARDCSSRAILERLLRVEFIVLGVGIGGAALFKSFYPPIFAIIATGVLTFYGLLLHAVHHAPDARVQDRHIRSAIAAGLTSMYVVLVGYGVFIIKTEGQVIDPIAQHLITSFSSVVGIVIAFYFGSSAFIESRTSTTRDGGKDDGS